MITSWILLSLLVVTYLALECSAGHFYHNDGYGHGGGYGKGHGKGYGYDPHRVTHYDDHKGTLGPYAPWRASYKNSYKTPVRYGKGITYVYIRKGKKHGYGHGGKCTCFY